MQAQAGDELVVKGLHVGDAGRHGVIVEVHGVNGGPPYLVRWSDGHESSFFPSSDTVVRHIHQPASRLLPNGHKSRWSRQAGVLVSVEGRREARRSDRGE